MGLLTFGRSVPDLSHPETILALAACVAPLRWGGRLVVRVRLGNLSELGRFPGHHYRPQITLSTATQGAGGHSRAPFVETYARQVESDFRKFSGK